MNLWISFSGSEIGRDGITRDIESGESDIGHVGCISESFDETIDIE